MSNPLFDHAELRRIADALEGLLALARAHVTPAAPAAAPADFDGAQYADAFDAMMGNPLAALGNLTAKPTAADSAPVKPAKATRINWSKYDPRSRELARLRTAAEHRAKAAKTPETWTHWSKLDPRSRELARLATNAGKREKAAKTTATRDAAREDKNRYLNESKARQNRLRNWLADGKGIIDGDALYYFDADGTKVKFVPSPTPHFFLPY